MLLKILKEVICDNALSSASVFAWPKRFSEGREEMKMMNIPATFACKNRMISLDIIREILRKDLTLKRPRLVANIVNTNKRVS